MTPKRVRTDPEHIGEKQEEDIQYINQLNMDGDGKKHQMETMQNLNKQNWHKL